MAHSDQSPTSSYVEVPSLVYRLCAKETKLPSDVVTHLYGATLNLVGSQSQAPQLDETDEFYIMEKIKKKLFRENRESEALRLEELYHKLKRQGSVKNPAAMLMFLYCMSSESDEKLPLLHSLAATPTTPPEENGFGKTKYISSSSSSLASIPPPDMAKLLPTVDPIHLTNTFMNVGLMSGVPPFIRRTAAPRGMRPHSVHGLGLQSSSKNVNEVDLLREILFAFQGLNGRMLIQDPSNDSQYQIHSKYQLNPSTKIFAKRLSNIGWLFNKVNKFSTAVNRDPECGHVMQSFAAALNEEILEYYRLITVIEQQLHTMTSYGIDTTSGEPPLVSLHRLQIWSFDHFYRLKMLAILIEKCRDRRGGVLASYVYKAMQHGDPQLRSCLTRILKQVVLPIRKMLSQWIFHGVLDDVHKEFFILEQVTNGATGDLMWQDKFIINRQMIPGFIPLDQARKILATGKAINLLLKVGGDQSSSVPGYDDLKNAFEATDVELLFKESRNNEGDKGEFKKLLHSAYKETSLKARKILFDDFRLMDHLNGLRQFLLLGQGDFIRHLMDLLAPELEKPAKRLQTHALNSLLNSAIRATNAQFLNDDVINRLDCTLNCSSGTTGWDVFSLAYQTKGPIGTILTPRCMRRYSSLFRHLWRSKRMEYVLCVVWKKQKVNDKLLKFIPALKPIFHQCTTLLSEMTHFIQQMQYYIEFEVIECSWAEFIRRIEASEDIDQLVESHEWFLQMILSRSMISVESQEIYNQLREIYNAVINFQHIHEGLTKLTDAEVEARNRSLNNSGGDESIVAQEQEERILAFENEHVPKYHVKIRLLSTTYEAMVQKFLILLASHQDLDLQFLSVRLDFNEHYKKRNKSLETSFTYSHRLSIDTSK
ncbi:Gamma-tubulin complex component 3 [Halotydeus destructor]|nr:Gamma-tubulin complex component 3 [Halotydeus destructor]